MLIFALSVTPSNTVQASENALSLEPQKAEIIQLLIQYDDKVGIKKENYSDNLVSIHVKNSESILDTSIC